MRALAVATWIASVVKRDVSIVDSVWSLLIVLGALAYAARTPIDAFAPRALVAAGARWPSGRAARAYITWRNWGEPRGSPLPGHPRTQPARLRLKSLYLVFGLQARARVDRRAAAARRALRATQPLGAARRGGVAAAAFGIRLRSGRRLAARALQGRSGDHGPRAGPRAVALHAPSQLLRRVLRSGGASASFALAAGAGGRSSRRC